MAKIVIVGAGSGFGGRLSVDMLSHPAMQDATIALCDLDEKKLAAVATYVTRVAEKHKLRAKVIGSPDRRKLLRGADFVITSISVGGAAYHSPLHKLETGIPAKYGIIQSVADTIGVGGVFRFLRTAPVQLEILRDVQRLAPNALVLNYTNPMAMLTWLHSVATGVRNVGLCHSVQHTMRRLAGFCNVPYEEVKYWVAGINHQGWILEFRHGGRDAYDLLRKAMKKPEIYKQDMVRFEIMRHFGYFVTESSSHMSEYVPYFRRTAKMIRQYRLIHRRKKLPRGRPWLTDPNTPVPDLAASDEYASGIMKAVLTDKPYRFNGNVMNHGAIANLPANACVEVPCLADGQGIHACQVGELPPQLAAINRSNIAVQELAVQAVLNRDKEAAFHAVAVDPLTSSVAPLDRIRDMFEELWKAERHMLRHFDK